MKKTLGVAPLIVSLSENPSNFNYSTEGTTVIFCDLIKNNNLLSGFYGFSFIKSDCILLDKYSTYVFAINA